MSLSSVMPVLPLWLNILWGKHVSGQKTVIHSHITVSMSSIEDPTVIWIDWFFFFHTSENPSFKQGEITTGVVSHPVSDKRHAELKCGNFSDVLNHLWLPLARLTENFFILSQLCYVLKIHRHKCEYLKTSRLDASEAGRKLLSRRRYSWLLFTSFIIISCGKLMIFSY